MSLINNPAKSDEKSAAKGAQGVELTGDGLGESDDFFNRQNHLFINKLNYICKHYDTAFNDVSLTDAWIKLIACSQEIDFICFRSKA